MPSKILKSRCYCMMIGKIVVWMLAFFIYIENAVQMQAGGRGGCFCISSSTMLTEKVMTCLFNYVIVSGKLMHFLIKFHFVATCKAYDAE